MSYYFTDEEIKSLVDEEKIFDGSLDAIMDFKESDGHKSASVELRRTDGSKFIIKLRQNLNNVNDFSVIFALQGKGISKDFKLRRYNGKSHQHSNRLEGNRFYTFHVHYATKRYQDAGRKEESYAEETERYSDIKGALRCLLSDCNIKTKLDPQTSLFDK